MEAVEACGRLSQAAVETLFSGCRGSCSQARWNDHFAAADLHSVRVTFRCSAAHTSAFLILLHHLARHEVLQNHQAALWDPHGHA